MQVWPRLRQAFERDCGLPIELTETRTLWKQTMNIKSLAHLASGMALIAGMAGLTGCGPTPMTRTTTTTEQITTMPPPVPVPMQSTTTTETQQMHGP